MQVNAKAAPAAVSERAAFEAWAKPDRSQQGFLADGTYRDSGMDCAWNAWKARAALSPPPSVGEPPKCTVQHTCFECGNSVGMIFCRECLKRATDGAKPAGEPAYTPVDLNAEDDTYEDDADLVVEYTAAYADWRLEGGSFAACEAAEKKLRAALAAAPDSQGAPKPVALSSMPELQAAVAAGLADGSLVPHGAQAAGQEDAS